MSNLNKKGFAVYYVGFFVLLIFLFAFAYFNRITNTTVNLVRDFEKMKAKNLCDLALAASKNIIYKNYSSGNMDFYKKIKFPIKKEYRSGYIYIKKISFLDKIKKGKNWIKKDFNNIPNYIKGSKNGVYDIFRIEIECESARGEKVEMESLIKVIRREIIR